MPNYRKNIAESVLKKTQILKSDINLFIDKSASKSIKKGDYLIKDGQICNSLYYMHSGSFRSFFYSNNNIYVNDFGVEKQFFTSFQSFISNKPSHINMQAMQDCEISIWTKSLMEKLYREKNQWQEFGRKLAEEFFSESEMRAFSLMSESAKIKFLHFKKHNSKILKIAPQYDIASYIGITPESLSRLKKSIIVEENTDKDYGICQRSNSSIKEKSSSWLIS